MKSTILKFISRLFGAMRLLVFPLLLTASVKDLLAESPRTEVVFFGGAGQIGGSCALVRQGNTRILIDCGSFQGEEIGREDDASSNKSEQAFTFNPAAISDLVVTHAHQDHVGRIPLLIKNGFKGRIWMTPETKSLYEITLRSQATYDDTDVRRWRWTIKSIIKREGYIIKAHWREECKWNQKIAKSNLRNFTGTYSQLSSFVDKDNTSVSGCKECRDIEAKEVLAFVRTVPFGQQFRIPPFSIEFGMVKHIPGSACVYINDGRTSCVFSGDIGTLRSRMVKSISPARKVDAVFVEATYGDTTKGTKADSEKECAKFRSEIAKDIKAGRLVWIPAFALDRSQRVLLEIGQLIKEGRIPKNTPIFYLSPSSRELTELYARHPEWSEGGRSDAELLNIAMQYSSKKFNPDTDTKGILLTTSGMMDAGVSAQYLPVLAPRKGVSIYLVGYQSPGTYGQIIRDTPKNLIIDGHSVKVKARVNSYGCFSGHGDAREIDDWLANNRDSTIILIHGDSKSGSLEKRKQGLEKRFGSRVEIATTRKKFTICRPRSTSRKAKMQQTFRHIELP